ncbi:hypothetical protein BKA69DRAFT_1172250 [Paraphysoderma sedebokerense]|nr:hypothetical protein BKA69DRAFT_1172250 [Paraphysoderma sedebokerense]
MNIQVPPSPWTFNQFMNTPPTNIPSYNYNTPTNLHFQSTYQHDTCSRTPFKRHYNDDEIDIEVDDIVQEAVSDFCSPRHKKLRLSDSFNSLASPTVSTNSFTSISTPHSNPINPLAQATSATYSCTQDDLETCKIVDLTTGEELPVIHSSQGTKRNRREGCQEEVERDIQQRESEKGNKEYEGEIENQLVRPIKRLKLSCESVQRIVEILDDKDYFNQSIERTDNEPKIIEIETEPFENQKSSCLGDNQNERDLISSAFSKIHRVQLILPNSHFPIPRFFPSIPSDDARQVVLYRPLTINLHKVNDTENSNRDGPKIEEIADNNLSMIVEKGDVVPMEL